MFPWLEREGFGGKREKGFVEFSFWIWELNIFEIDEEVDDDGEEQYKLWLWMATEEMREFI